MALSATVTSDVYSSDVSGDLTVDADSITPHQIISLLFGRALQRIDQATVHVSQACPEKAAVMVGKVIGIVYGLRDSLDLEKGGDIANNLDMLYEYIIQRLETMDDQQSLAILAEVKELLQDLYLGWQGIADQADSL